MSKPGPHFLLSDSSQRIFDTQGWPRRFPLQLSCLAQTVRLFFLGVFHSNSPCLSERWKKDFRAPAITQAKIVLRSQVLEQYRSGRYSAVTNLYKNILECFISCEIIQFHVKLTT